MHPDAQPAPPGVLDSPPAVLYTAARQETDAAATADRMHDASVQNEELLPACWPSRCLIVLCDGTVDAMSDHPLLLENKALLVTVSPLSEEECVQQGGVDPEAPLWKALEEGCPMVVFEAHATTRRAREQLLFRLSKQAAAATYSWEVMAGSDGGAERVAGGKAKEAVPPTKEEGWHVVHPSGPTS